MDKPTVPDPADLGPPIPGTEEYKRTEEALEAIPKAQEADPVDPELRRRRQKIDATLTAEAARCNGRIGYEAGLQEELIRDARMYAESLLGEAGSTKARLKLTRRILVSYIPTHQNKDALILGFRDLHAAIWTEGCPSLEERANAAIQEQTEQVLRLKTPLPELLTIAPEVPDSNQRKLERGQRLTAALERWRASTSRDIPFAWIHNAAGVDHKDAYNWKNGKLLDTSAMTKSIERILQQPNPPASPIAE